MSNLRRSRASNPVIDEIVRECALRIEEAIREQVAARLDEAVARALAARGMTDAVSANSSPMRPKRMCPVPGCGIPAAGPRYSWRCREHKDVSKEALLRLRAETKVNGAASAKPSGVQGSVRMTKLPPGPAPGERKRRGPPMECRTPGCTVKSRGPRFEFFCGEHFRAFSPEERRSLAEAFKQRRLEEKRLAETRSKVEQTVREPSVLLRRGDEVRRVNEPVAAVAVGAEHSELDP